MDSTGGPPLPLAGFRVLDFTRFLAGPYAAMVLAGLGAYDRSAPWLGQHTEQVLREELGVGEAELRELIERGVAYNKHPEAAQ